MATYRFRVTFEDFDDITRDIEIRSTQTFEEFHYAIQNAIGFDASKPTSFFLSDDNCKKGKEMKNSTKLMIGAVLLIISGPLPIVQSIVPLLAGGFMQGSVLYYIMAKERQDERAARIEEATIRVE